MTTKRRLQSESESGDGGSPPNTTKIQKTSNPGLPDTPLDDDLPNLPSSAAHNLRVSVRVLRKKEERKESEGGAVSDDTQDPQGIDDCNSNNNDNDQVQRKKRAWGLWSAEDQSLFFVALNECGKNFDAIQLFFQTKAKKGNKAPTLGNVYKHKEQIRTFYYRTWHKISKYIEFPENLKKSSRELYALINYGELRKKVGNNLDWKKGGKLQELVFNGHTTVRCKGKTIRLRTPTCPALKRLNFAGNNSSGKILSGNQGSRGNSKEVVLPPKVTIELTPLLVNDFYRVNRLALSNPRVCATLALDRRLSSVIKKLESKFRPLDDRTWLSCVAVLPQNSDLKITPCLPGRPKSDSELWIVPRPGTTLSRPSITTQEPTTSTSLSLSHLQSKLEPSSSGSDEIKDPQSSWETQPTLPQTTTSPEVSVEIPSKTEDEIVDNEVEDLGSMSSPEVNEHPPLPFHHQELLHGNCLFKEENIKEGWNVETGDQISIGELYLMMGVSDCSKPVIHLSYTWKKRKLEEEKPCDDLTDESSSGALRALVKLANAELARKHSSKMSNGPGCNGANLNGSPLHSKRLPRPNVIHSPRPISEMEVGGVTASTSNPSTATAMSSVDGTTSNTSSVSAEFRRPAVPPARSAQHQAFRQQMDLLLPKFNQRKGRPMSRSKSYLVRQLQAAGNRPLQPKNPISTLDDTPKKLIPRVTNGSHHNNVATYATLIPNHITIAVQPQVSARPFLELGRSSNEGLLVESSGNDTIPQISIPSPAYSHSEPQGDEQEEEEDIDAVNGNNIGFGGNNNDSFSVNLSSLFDENSRSDMEPQNQTLSRAITSTPSHMQVDHFLDSVLENSNSSLLQTPRRHSPPPSPPGGMSEHSWLPDLSLSSFLGSLPTDGGVGNNESPSKMLMSHQEDSIQSTGSEVDRQLSMMLNENSLDFTSKFAHLASALNSTD